VAQVVAHRDTVVDRDPARLVDENPQQTAPGALQQHQLVAECGKHGFQSGGQIQHVSGHHK